MFWEYENEIIAESRNSSLIGNITNCDGFDVCIDINDADDIIYVKNEHFVQTVIDDYLEEFHYDVYDVKIFWNNSDRQNGCLIQGSAVSSISYIDDRIHLEDERLLNSFFEEFDFHCSDFKSVISY